MTAVVLLTRTEADRLAECEEKIHAGLQTFVDVGTALAAIRDGRLYRADYPTFEAYLEERWQISRSYAHRMIAAADAVLPIGNTDLPMPSNEGQARELARIPESERAEVWRETVERTDGKPTAKAIADVRRDRNPSPNPPPADREPPSQPPSPPTVSGPDLSEVMSSAIEEAVERNRERAEHNAWVREVEATTPPETKADIADLGRRLAPVVAIEEGCRFLLGSVRGVDPARAAAEAPDGSLHRLAIVGEAITFLTRVEQAMGARQ